MTRKNVEEASAGLWSFRQLLSCCNVYIGSEVGLQLKLHTEFLTSLI